MLENITKVLNEGIELEEGVSSVTIQNIIEILERADTEERADDRLAALELLHDTQDALDALIKKF